MTFKLCNVAKTIKYFFFKKGFNIGIYILHILSIKGYGAHKKNVVESFTNVEICQKLCL